MRDRYRAFFYRALSTTKANNSDHSRNQHLVPRFLLKNFESDKKSHIWTFDKLAESNNWKIIKNRPISRVASEDYFYDKIKNSKEDSYENELGRNEKKVSPIIRDIINSQDISFLSNEDINELSLFICLQALRTKTRLNDTLRINQELEKNTNQFPGYNVKFDSRKLWFSLMDSAKEIAPSFAKKVWILGISNKNFYCSDHPVVLQNTTNKKEGRSTLGIDSYGIEIYLPLSDSIILCLFCEKLFGGYNKKNRISNLDFKEDNILNVNHLQYLYSDRFIFSSHKKFDLLK